jgi:ArsR family transcriptional regulator, lead/cadmium/zinc/bismuth-responsive transcriptional repressor
MSKEVSDYVRLDTRKVERIKRAIPDDDSSQRMAETFRVLSDPTRLRIISALELDELCVCDIAALASLTQSLVSHHLQNLRQMKIVKYRREGKMSFYALSDSHVRAMLAIARDHAREYN